MNNQEDINKRLLQIKELAQLAKDDPELEIFNRVIYKINKKKKTKELKYELPWRSFLMPLIHLIHNETEAANNFWKLLHRWFFQKRTPMQSLDLEDITFILSSLDKTNTKKSLKVLEKFKKFTLTNELLDEASPFITSDLMHKATNNPAFETNDADISEFIESTSYTLIKGIIASYGIEEFAKVTNLENFPDFDAMKILDKHKLVRVNKGIYKHIYDSTKDALQIEAKEDPHDWSHWSMSIAYGLSGLDQFPSMKDFDEVLDLHWSDKLMGATHFDIYLMSLDYLQKLIAGRAKLFSNINRSKYVTLEEMAYVIGSKNTKTIRNEFFKNDNKLRYFDASKNSITIKSAQKWIKDPKRKQPIYEPLFDTSFPDLSLDYIMEL
jgi:hypothetical protein